MFCAPVARPIIATQPQIHAALTGTDDDFIDFALPSKASMPRRYLYWILNCHVTFNLLLF